MPANGTAVALPFRFLPGGEAPPAANLFLFVDGSGFLFVDGSGFEFTAAEDPPPEE